MITKYLIIGGGFFLSRLPYSALEIIVHALARLYLSLPSKRKKLLFSNLTYAFPYLPKLKIKDIARKTTVCLFEMGFFSLIYPHLSRYERRATMLFSQEIENKLKSLRKGSRPILILLPHVSLFEAVVTSQVFRPYGGKSLGAIYRPNSNPSIDTCVNRSRTDLGLRIFSRKKGFIQAKRHLDQGNWLALLFDQNAGDSGTLDLFLNRIVSYTSLPDTLVKSSKALPIFVFPKRVSFFKSELLIEDIAVDTNETVSSTVHKKLESLILADSNGLPEWLWSHGKWKVHARVESRYRMIVKRKHIIKDKKIERVTNFFVRLPNWLGDVVMAIPVLIAIREGRPDVRFTLVCKSEYVELLNKFNLGEDFITLPEKSFLYFLNFRKKIRFEPENYLLFTDSLRSDIEAMLSGSPQRFGVKLTGRIRPLLSHAFNSSESGGSNNSQLHQTLAWEEMARHFGLREKIDSSPLLIPLIKRKINKIGIIAGSSNSPEKRWAVENWISLINEMFLQFKDIEVHLFGTINDKQITTSIFSGIKSGKLYNRAGQTDLVHLTDELASCSCVIGNDTGSIHLANMVGTPIVVLFGPTKKEKTGPFFSAQKKVLEGAIAKPKPISPPAVFPARKVIKETLTFLLSLEKTYNENQNN